MCLWAGTSQRSEFRPLRFLCARPPRTVGLVPFTRNQCHRINLKGCAMQCRPSRTETGKQVHTTRRRLVFAQMNLVLFWTSETSSIIKGPIANLNARTQLTTYGTGTRGQDRQALRICSNRDLQASATILCSICTCFLHFSGFKLSFNWKLIPLDGQLASSIFGLGDRNPLQYSSALYAALSTPCRPNALSEDQSLAMYTLPDDIVPGPWPPVRTTSRFFCSSVLSTAIRKSGVKI